MSQFKLFLIVLVVHVAALLLFNQRPQVAPLKPGPVVVETITFAPPPPPKPKPKPRPRPKPKPVAKAKPKPKAKAPTPDKKKQELVKKVQKSIAKIETPKPKVALPDYRKTLGEHIQLLLRLPEEGTVKVKLTLKRSGEVATLEVLDCTSVSNREYVHRTLPKLHFQPFGRAFEGEEKHTFQLTLYGDS